MNRFSLALLLTALLTLLAVAGPAQAASKTCVPKKGAKSTWHDGGVRSYTVKSKVYACSSKYGKHFRLEPNEFESDSFSRFRTNGRYLFYVRSFSGPATSGGSIGRLLDLKTGESTKKLGPRDIDYAATPECAPLEINCYRSAWGAAIGLARSFVIGYRMQFVSPEGKDLGEQFWIERHCFQPGLTSPTRTILDKVMSMDDLGSIRRSGNLATWRNGPTAKSAPFC
ncbi:MAG: hypothetical protein JHD02_07280 [Thermoleophilaceae bacterium]|nr:hypothetical protein [Thermoleophilaceae bacterium]